MTESPLLKVICEQLAAETSDFKKDSPEAQVRAFKRIDVTDTRKGRTGKTKQKILEPAEIFS